MSGEEPTPQMALVESPQMIYTVKLPILKKGEYTLWSMRIEQYLTNTYYSSWQIIMNGDEPVQTTKDENGVETEVPSKSTQAILARQKERKAKSIMLLAIPDEYQLRFHTIKDAKSLWAAIKSRFGGNVESKKMQKNVLKQQFENFSVSDTEGLDKAYDRDSPFSWNNVALIMRNKDGIDDLDIDDLYNNLNVFEADIKGSSGSSSNSQNVAFLSAEDTSSSFDKTKVECFNCHRRGHFARECRATRNQGNMNGDERYRSKDNTRRTVPVETSDALVVQDNALIVQDGLGYDWSYIAQDEPTEFALMAYTSNSSGSDTEVQSCSKNCVKTYEKLQKQFDEQRQTLSKANLEIVAYQLGLESVEAQLIVHQKNEAVYEEKIAVLEFEVKDKGNAATTNKTSASVSQVETSITPPSNTSVEMPRVESVRPSGVIIEDWMPKESILGKGTGYREVRPIWNNTQRINHQNKFVPTAVLTRSGRIPVSTAKQVLKVKVNTVKVNGVNTVGQTTVSTVKGNGVIAVKASACCVWRPKKNDLNNGSKDSSGSWISKRGNLQQSLKYKGMFDSGCSRHMTGNKALLTDYKDIDGGFVAFGGSTRGGNLVRVLLHKNFEMDHTCVACQKGKATQASLFKTKLVSSSSQPLLMLNMDLLDNICKEYQPKGPIALEMDEFCGQKGIKREYSVARTPQQDRVVERKNRTLIKAVRTMLADSLLPIVFWAEVVNTACYVLNRVLVTKPHNKTPYELIIGRAPSISFMRPFRCPVTILNTLDPLGKFDRKVEEGFLVGYFVNSKAFRIDKAQGDTVNDDACKKTIQEPRSEYDQALKNVLDKMMDQENEATEQSDAVRKEFEAYTPVNTASASRTFSPVGPSSRPSFVTFGGSFPIDVANLPHDPLNADWEDTAKIQSAGADFNNMEPSTVASPIPTTRVQSIHPKAQIIRDPKSVVQTRGMTKKNSGKHAMLVDEACPKELGDRMERGCHYCFMRLRYRVSSSDVDAQKLATARTSANGEVELTATIDGQVKTITEASLRRHLKLEDNGGVTTLPNSEIFEQLALMGYVTDSDKLTFKRVGALENELQQTKKTCSTAITRLILRVKKLDQKVKTTKAKRRARIVLSEDEEDVEDSSKQGRKISAIDKDPTISLVQPEQEMEHDVGIAEETTWFQEDAEIQEKNNADTEILLQEEEPTELVEDQGSGEKVTTAEVSTAAENLVYIRRSVEKKKDKGKEIMTQPKPEKKTKKQLEQERLGHEETVRLQEQLNEEETQRIARDAEIARQLHEEINKVRQERVVAKYDQAHVIDWSDPAVLRYHAQLNRPYSVAEVRKNMVMYLKNQGGYKMNYFKGMKYEDIRPIFEKVWDQNQSFIPMDFEDKEKGSKKNVGGSRKKTLARKRAGEKQSDQSAKRQKTEYEKEKEELKAYLDLVLRDEFAMEIESLATKYPIVDWKTHVLIETFMYYQIIRANGGSKNYKIFSEMLDDFDRQDVWIYTD
ncbi:ribonuclease H-like domain-containing protein [Tanacetum coccineum]